MAKKEKEKRVYKHVIPGEPDYLFEAEDTDAAIAHLDSLERLTRVMMPQWGEKRKSKKEYPTIVWGENGNGYLSMYGWAGVG